MTSYILALIMLVLQVYILKHTYWARVFGCWEDAYEKMLQPIKVPVWIVALLVLASLIPYVWIVSSVVFWILWLKKYLDPEGTCSSDYNTYWRFRDNFLMRTI